jgi:hypothetical protein
MTCSPKPGPGRGCGDPGIGKTRLAAEFARAAYRAGAMVLAGRCDREQIVPYQPFAEALKHLVAAIPAGALQGHHRQLGPRPGAACPAAPPPGVVARGPLRHAMFRMRRNPGQPAFR